MDNDSYHSIVTDQIPNRGRCKKDIQQWLRMKRKECDPREIIIEILLPIASYRRRRRRRRRRKYTKELKWVTLKSDTFLTIVNITQ